MSPSHALAGALATWVPAALVLAACSREPRPPNILIVSIDTLRADHLGCYGYARDTSPAIDALAKRGTLFENAWSTTSWTLPSHVSMFTGLPISVHAQCDFDLEATLKSPAHRPRGRFVSETLAAAGYDGAGFYSCIYLEPKFGFGAGFDTWTRAYRSFKTEPGVAERWTAAQKAGDVEALKRIHAENPELFDQEVRTTPVAVDGALRWIEERKGDRDPFLLFLHVYDLHTPYTPPEPFASRFDPDYRGVVDGRKLGDADSPMHAAMDPRDLEHVIALYDGEIAALDAELARLFDGLERAGALESTLVIVTADHGEEFFEHGGKLHGAQLFRETLQVPLIVVWPGRVPAGARNASTVGLIDLAPTLLAAAGLPPDAALPGADLRVLANGAAAAHRTLTGSLTLHAGVEQPVWMFSLVDDREHVVVRDSGTEHWSAVRYDLAADPRERGAGAVVDATSPDASALLERLERERAKMRMLRQLAPERALEGGALQPEERLHLHQLGYADAPRTTGSREDLLCCDGCVWRR